MEDVATSHADSSPQETAQTKARLWNPNAAANWSILLSPIFGAYIHALNWRTLGMPERARANVIWVWLTIAFILVDMSTVFANSESLDWWMRKAYIAFLAGWYFIQGRSQANYVRDELRNEYEKKDWGKPLLIGFGIVLGILAAFHFAALIAEAIAASQIESEE